MSNKFDSVRIQREDHALPSKIDGICQLVEQVLRAGSVKKIIMEMGQPMMVYRMVSEGEQGEAPIELDAALRNIQMAEIPSSGVPADVLLDMHEMLLDEEVMPICFVTGPDSGLLYEWLGRRRIRRSRREVLLGLPVERLRSLPEETFLLCGAVFAEAEPKDITFAVKTTIEVRHDKANKQ